VHPKLGFFHAPRLLIAVFLAQRNAGVELGASRMTTVSPIDRKRPLMSWLGCVALSLFWILPAAAQQADPLEQQLKELKQEYEATTQALQLRMATLEQQIESQKEAAEKTKEATVSAVRFGGRTCG
jgi:predicted ribosome quality control (RQC) complex YloA/Tae2 family protein